MLNFGLFGAGRIGLTHVRAIKSLDNAILLAVHDVDEKAAGRVTAMTGAKQNSVEGILSDPEIDAVIIASPTDLHADQIELAARAGKQIFCEKPIDLSIERVSECLETVEVCGVQLMVGFNRRFDPDFARVRKEVEDGTVGAVELVQITSRDPSPPPVSYIARSGGLFRDMMIHDFDMARFLLDEEVTSIHAIGSVLIDREIELAGDFDTATATLKTGSGKIAVITNSRRTTYGYDQRIEVHGSKGLVSACNRRPTTVVTADAQGYRQDPLLNFFMERYASAYQLELTHFVAAIQAGESVRPNGEDGLKALALADAALVSAQTGQTVNL